MVLWAKLGLLWTLTACVAYIATTDRGTKAVSTGNTGANIAGTLILLLTSGQAHFHRRDYCVTSRQAMSSGSLLKDDPSLRKLKVYGQSALLSGLASSHQSYSSPISIMTDVANPAACTSFADAFASLCILSCLS